MKGHQGQLPLTRMPSHMYTKEVFCACKSVFRRDVGMDDLCRSHGGALIYKEGCLECGVEQLHLVGHAHEQMHEHCFRNTQSD